MPSTAEVASLYNRLRVQNTDRDKRMRDIKLVRGGQMDHVFPELFPEDGPFTRPIVANMIDVAARDLAEEDPAVGADDRIDPGRDEELCEPDRRESPRRRQGCCPVRQPSSVPVPYESGDC